MTATHKHTTKKGVLAGEVVSRLDAERLVLEGIERLGARADGLGRRELICLLRQVLELGVEAVAQRERTCSLAEAGWASIAARSDCRKTTLRDLRYNLRRILKLPGVGEHPLRAMTTAQCRDILQRAFGHSKSSYVKGRAMLSSIFSHGIRQEWCDTNPVSRIEVPRVEEKPVEPLTPAMVERLKAAAAQPEHRDMQLSLNLLLYSGIRPAEVSRLQEGDFCREEGVVIIRPQKSKTGGGRLVPLRGLSTLPPEIWKRPIPRNWQRRWRALRRAADLAHWQADACRHTFASYHAAYFRDLPALQLEMGHRDLTLLRSRYVMPMHRKAAAMYWEGAEAGKASGWAVLPMVGGETMAQCLIGK
ncbi:MAG: hypothetical protein IJB33_07030 [Akkermansia sp.]|nr:hypothetical protein [Akkermansia sp.]